MFCTVAGFYGNDTARFATQSNPDTLLSVKEDLSDLTKGTWFVKVIICFCRFVLIISHIYPCILFDGRNELTTAVTNSLKRLKRARRSNFNDGVSPEMRLECAELFVLWALFHPVMGIRNKRVDLGERER